MDVFTLYAGQGDLAATKAGGESLIIDAHMPECDDVCPDQLQSSLTGYVADTHVRGLIVTGLDKDHACPLGVDWILTTLEPDWIMYPKYYKDSDAASEVFATIDRHRRRRERTLRPLVRHSVHVQRADSRVLTGLASSFNLELFSPHMADMDCSNNCSIVLKVTGLDRSGFSYLVTGDTETDRWDNINRFFGDAIKCDVMSAPHHGAKSGLNARTLFLASPNTVLISAGVGNSYGHPDGAAVHAYQLVAEHVFATNAGGRSNNLFTRRQGDDFQTILVEHDEKSTARASFCS